MLKHDIELPSKIPGLLLEKHVKYLVSYGTDKDEYVRACLGFLFYCLNMWKSFMTKNYNYIDIEFLSLYLY